MNLIFTQYLLVNNSELVLSIVQINPGAYSDLKYLINDNE